MSAQELRKAAETLRERAKAAVDPPWIATEWTDHAHYKTAVVVGGHANYLIAEIGGPDAAYIATMHPGVGLALARWLDDIAAGWMWDGEEPGVVDWDGDGLTLEDSMDSHALHLARLINGGAS